MSNLHSISDRQKGTSALKEYNYIEIAILLERARQKEEAAFDRLMERCIPAVAAHLRNQGCRSDDLEDSLAQAKLAMFRCLESPVFENMNGKNYLAYFCKVGENIWNRIARRAATHATMPLVYTDQRTGEMVELEVGDPGRGFDERVVDTNLYQFILDAMEEVFVRTRPADKQNRGRMERDAFIRYYVDGETQGNILLYLQNIAATVGEEVQITEADLNNWLSNGRSLSRLLKWLIDRHNDLLKLLVDMHFKSVEMPQVQKDTLQSVCVEGRTIEEIARSRAVPLNEVRQELKDSRKRFLEELTRIIKDQLHESRKRSNR